MDLETIAMERAAKKRIDGDGDISLGIGKKFGVSIGSLLGSDAKPAEKIGEPRAESGGKTIRADERKMPRDFLKTAARAILRRESAGRGGRTVTTVELRPEPDNRTAEELAKMMRKSLGCGSHVEPRKIVLQGDMRERAALWLEKQGVREISSG
ncbi:MAG: translation initiation factor [Synergistaceae bacterium]|jgi:translation initiation factor 1 (eIF-1/SUI1)|nr:translation initiation factor [Synergistaceae bacterium]